MAHLTYLNSKSVEAVLTFELEKVCEQVGIVIKNILDIDTALRVTSFCIEHERIVRYYHAYGVFVMYKYNMSPIEHDDKYSLLDMKVYRVDANMKLKHACGFETYLRSLLNVTIPSFFKRYEITDYRILYINTFPPFIDEAYHTVGMNTNIIHDLDYTISYSHIGFFVLEVSKKQYVCKAQSNRKGAYAAMNRFDVCNMITTYVNSHNSRILGINKDDFMNKSFAWVPLEECIGVSRRKAVLNNLSMHDISRGKLNEIGQCGDLAGGGM